MKKAYPNANVRIVVGTLTDSDVIEKEAAAADIVVRTSCVLFREVYMENTVSAILMY